MSYVVFRASYPTVGGGRTTTWLAEFVREEDAGAREAELKSAGCTDIEAVPEERVPLPIREQAERHRADAKAKSARAQLDLLLAKPTPRPGATPMASNDRPAPATLTWSERQALLAAVAEPEGLLSQPKRVIDVDFDDLETIVPDGEPQDDPGDEGKPRV